MGGGRRGGGRGAATGSRGAVPVGSPSCEADAQGGALYHRLVIGHGGGGAEGLHVLPSEAGREPGEFAFDDGLKLGGIREGPDVDEDLVDRKSTRLNSSH